MKTIRNLKRIILASILTSISCIANAGIVKGIVRDTLSNEGVPFVNIKIFNEIDSVSPAALFATDADGVFSESLNSIGNMRILFESMGKKSVLRTISISEDETIDLGIIQMADDETILGEIEVTAIRPIVKAESDKLSYNVKDDSDSKTYTLLDMLRKVPMVSVDGEDNISVNGSSNFQVYVNSKPSIMFSSNPGQIFKSMPASMVKSIEVVTNPGARYDAEGTGGILNLIMNQQQGWNDTDGYTAGIGMHGGSRGFDGNINMSGQNGKLSYSVNAMHNQMYPGNTDVSDSQIFHDRTITTHTEGKPHMNFSLGNLSADYAIDSLSAIGFSGSVSSFGMRSRGTTATDLLSSADPPMFSYSSQGAMDMNRLSATGSLSLSHGFTDKYNSNLSVIYQLSYERNKTANEFNFSDPDYDNDILDLSDRKSNNLENTLDNIIQADFTTHLRDGHSLDTGVKIALRRSRSSSMLDFLEIEAANENTHYKNHTNIFAGYAEYSFPVSRVNFKAGLRYEYTWQDINYATSDNKDFSRRYGILVPSASLSYNLSMSSNVGLTYNMKIARPGISYMNPYIDHSDPTSVSFGNPYLNVEKTHNIGITYNLFSPKFIFNTRLTDSYTGNGIEQYRYLSDGLLTTTYGNVAKRNYLRLDASATWMATNNTCLILNGSAGYVTLKNKQMNLSNNGCQWNVMAGLQQTLPCDIKGSVYLIASSKSYTIEGWNSGFKMLAISLSKTFFNNRLSVSAGFNTGLSKDGKMIIENYSHTSEFENHNFIRMPMLSANVGISYTLGSYQPKHRANRKSVDSDYMEQRSEMESFTGAAAPLAK